MDSILETYFLGTLADKEEMVEYIQTDTGPNTDRQTDRHYNRYWHTADTGFISVTACFKFCMF